MIFKEKVRKWIKRLQYIFDDRKAEWSLAWIDNILYYINGKNRVIVEEHFTEEGKTAEALIEKTVIYENAHGVSNANAKNEEGKAS